MPDDFEDIKLRMRGYEELMQGFFFTMGMTLSQCQAFEDRLRQYKTLVHDFTPDMTGEQLNQLLLKSRAKDTLGSLLRDLAKKMTFDAETKTLLDAFLAERNWFVHHFEYQHGLTVFNQQELTPIIKRLCNIQRQSLHLQNHFADLTVAWTEKQGHSRAEIDAATRARLNHSIKPFRR